MTPIRSNADLAPARYQLPVYALLLMLALATLISDFHWVRAMASPWLAVMRGACFLILGATWIVWPTGKIGNPLVTRIIGALIVVASLFILVKFFLYHPI